MSRAYACSSSRDSFKKLRDKCSPMLYRSISQLLTSQIIFMRYHETWFIFKNNACRARLVVSCGRILKVIFLEIKWCLECLEVQPFCDTKKTSFTNGTQASSCTHLRVIISIYKIAKKKTQNNVIPPKAKNKWFRTIRKSFAFQMITNTNVFSNWRSHGELSLKEEFHLWKCIFGLRLFPNGA